MVTGSTRVIRTWTDDDGNTWAREILAPNRVRITIAPGPGSPAAGKRFAAVKPSIREAGERARQMMLNAEQRECEAYCGIGPCAAEDGHHGTCAEASGWAHEDTDREPMSDERLAEARALAGAHRMMHNAATADALDELVAEVERLRADLAGYGTHGAIGYERAERQRLWHRWVTASRDRNLARELLADKKAEVERVKAWAALPVTGSADYFAGYAAAQEVARDMIERGAGIE